MSEAQKIEVPAFLHEMSQQINTQDNRCTADPMFMVCYDEEYVVQEGYNEKFIAFYGDEGKICDDSDLVGLAEYLEEYHEDWFVEFCTDNEIDSEETHEWFADTFDSGCHDLPDGVNRLAIGTRMTVVKACLAEADANWFIQRKQHDYPKLYTYVFSMVFCPQMIELRNWIKSLTPSPSPIGA